MKKKFLQYFLICSLLVFAIGVKTAPVQAACYCSCAATCSNRCDSECDCDSAIEELFESLACCIAAVAQAEREGWMQPCPEEGGQQ